MRNGLVDLKHGLPQISRPNDEGLDLPEKVCSREIEGNGYEQFKECLDVSNGFIGSENGRLIFL
jgi:hypothetical protein